MPPEARQCDNFPDWQGCECEKPAGHGGPHECVCGAQWDDDGRKLRPGYQRSDDVPVPQSGT
jgi:hypothetical protein